MPQMTPADELRSAATFIRRHTDGVTPGPWKSEATAVHGHRVGTTDEANWVAWTGEHNEENSARDADWIALLHPGVGLAIADWLETEANTWAGDEVHNRCTPQTCTSEAALAAARQIIGSQP